MKSAKRENGAEAPEPEGPPPLFSTWGRFYLFVVANTLFVFALLVLFSHLSR